MKIIATNKFKQHMQVHIGEFLFNWSKILDFPKVKNRLDYLTKDFEIIQVDLDYPVGFSSMIKTSTTDKIIYAKRIGRNYLTRFVRDKEKSLINSLVIILKQDRVNPNQYFLVTMYPGETSCKEPTDPNVADEFEMKQCINFWSNHALIYDESIIQTGTEQANYSYQNLLVS